MGKNYVHLELPERALIETQLLVSGRDPSEGVCRKV
jgi:hypothetical protein